MIRYKSSKQLSLEGFNLPFVGQLNAKNRWAKWSQVIPWDDLASCYYKTMDPTKGRPGKDARLVIGALIIKHKLNLSDEETILQIQENHYLQYFVGFSGYKDEPPFASSLFVDIRKRMGNDVFSGFEQVIRYPTDLSLLNEAREIAEKLIDELYALSDYTRKPRKYRRKARKQYLTIAKNKKPSVKVRRRGVREQLQYLRRNLKHISSLLDYLGSTPFPLAYDLQRQYWIIQHLYVQQDGMYQNRQKRCDDRIVSISQPHVRPIVRSKAIKKTEFGAKISVSMNNGLAFVDHIGWDAFNESTDLKQQVEENRRRFGYYPEVVLADQLYGSRDNRKYLKEKGIRFGGKALGRPPKETAENSEKIRAMKKQRIQDSRERIPIEGKFGQGKNGYRLNYIRAKLQKTSEAWISCIFLVMNLMVLLKKLGKKVTLTLLKRLFNLSRKISAQILRKIDSLISYPMSVAELF